MKTRRLSLSREELTLLGSDELSSVAGAISTQHPLCIIGTTSAQWSQCHSCGIACTSYDCYPTDTCA